MSLFRTAAWRKHPMLQVRLKDMLIGLPVGVGLLVVVTGLEATGILKLQDK
jgi:hypothetical protein